MKFDHLKTERLHCKIDAEGGTQYLINVTFEICLEFIICWMKKKNCIRN